MSELQRQREIERLNRDIENFFKNGGTVSVHPIRTAKEQAEFDKNRGKKYRRTDREIC